MNHLRSVEPQKLGNVLFLLEYSVSIPNNNSDSPFDH